MALTQDAMPRAAVALKAFLEKHGLRQVDLARGIGAPEPSVHNWVRGLQRPSEVFQRAIEIWTHDEVPAALWLTDEEWEKIAGIKPFRPAVPANDPTPPSPRRKARRSSAAA